jgi:scyllo-inositol 2-dehydrogenase (NADP+)
VRYLVVGLGNIGRRRVALLGPRCVATVDPVAPGADYRRVDNVPADRYDAVVLATPNRDKLEDARRFLRAGKSVLVEKPLLFDARRDVDALEADARGGAVWYTAYNHRFEPVVERLKAHLDAGAVGKPDRARFVYGNGTVRDWLGTWRETGAGVLEDLGCHLLDLAPWLLGRDDDRWVLWDLRPVESATFDYALFASADRRVVCEVGTVFWRNRFEIDVYGSEGSLHLRGLNKWGGATLGHHRRVYPSGAPVEQREATAGEDTSWTADLVEFERRVAVRETSAGNDWRISAAIASLMAQAVPTPDRPARKG